MGELSSFLIDMIGEEYYFSLCKINEENVAKYATHYRMVCFVQLPHGGGKKIVLENGGQSLLKLEF